MKSPNNIIHREILSMIKRYNRQYINKSQKILIHHAFPADKLIKIMKPYLILYLSITYSLIPLVKKQSELELTYKLQKFQHFNPNFGKFKNTIYIISDTNVITHQHFFIDEHIPFIKDNDFTTSHLSINALKYYYGTESLNDFANGGNHDADDDDDDTSDDDDDPDL